MASSQVEIAPSSPFGSSVHHRRRDPCFQNKLVVTSSCNGIIPNDNSHHIDFNDLWVHRPQWQTTPTPSPNINNKNCCNEGNNNDDGLSNIDSSSHPHKTKWARAREMVISVDPHHHHRTNKASGKGGSVEVPNQRGVSSLVQRWRGFEQAEAKCSRANTPTTSSSSSSFQENDDAFGDWESDRTTSSFSGPPSFRRDSDAAESERLRVADIIRKLTEDSLKFNDAAPAAAAGSESPPPPRVRTSPDQSEQRCLSPVVCSPRIRGRQAYNDLLMQMERDRHNELQGLIGRKPVSKFSHRGRIQALLRFRFLRRGMEVNGGRLSNSTSSQSHKAANVHFRERVNPSAKNGSGNSGSCGKELVDNIPAPPRLYEDNKQGNENQYNDVTNSKSCPGVGVQDSERTQTSKERDVDCSSHKVDDNNMQQNVHLLHSYGHHHETMPLSAFMGQETNCERSNHGSPESTGTGRTCHNNAETSNSIHDNEINIHDQEDTHQVIETNSDLTSDCGDPESCRKGESATYWVTDVSHPEVGWDELHFDYQQQEEGSTREWIDEVSRPRSDWEGLRQARYQEMLDPFLDNEDIRVLLERKSVSNFLSSGLREKIDRVMISRAQGQQTLENSQAQEAKQEQLPEHEQAVVSEEGEGQDGDEEGEEYGGYCDEYEEAESSMGQQYNEYTDNITSSLGTSSPQYQGHELSDYSYQVASPSTQQSSSNYYSQDNGPNSSYSAHPAIEMELIYDLRGHMEKLHQEMSELKKSIKCCMDMQIKLQRSIKKEVATALNHSDAKNGRKRVASRRGGCCVCCKMQVDSLLYRCGHMCTCFKCAHELQWSSGKCPICRAPIVDVVRIHSNYS